MLKINKLLINSVVQAVVIITVFTLFFLGLAIPLVLAFLSGIMIYVLIAMIFHILTLPFFILARIRGAVYVPSADDRIAAMLQLAKPKAGMRVVDLGSGDGRVMIAFAKAGAQVDGYEINPVLVRRSRLHIRDEKLTDKAVVHWKSLWEADLSKYDVVVVYGIPYIMKELGEKIHKEMPKGSVVLSNAFTFPEWQPKQSLDEVKKYLV